MFRWLRLAIIFLLPLLATHQLILFLEERKKTELFVEAEETLLRVDGQLRRRSTALWRYNQFAKLLIQNLISGKPPGQNLGKVCAKKMEVYLFDSEGKRIVVNGFSRNLVTVSERILKLFKKWKSDPEYVPGKLEKRLAEKFIGSSEALKALPAAKGRLLEIKQGVLPHISGWFQVASKNMGTVDVLVDVSLQDVTRLSLMEGAIRSLELSPDIQLGWIHDGENRELIPPSLPQECYQMLRKQHLNRVFQKNGQIICLRTIEPYLRMFSFQPFPAPPGVYIALKVIAWLFFLLLLIFIFHREAGGKTLSVSLRFQLITLFGLTGLAGILTLLGYSLTYRDIREKRIISERVEKSKLVLTKLDEAFPRARKGYARTYKKLTTKVAKRPDKVNAILGHLGKLIDSGLINALYFGNFNGEILFKMKSYPQFALSNTLALSGDNVQAYILQRAISKKFSMPISETRNKLKNPFYEYSLQFLINRLVPRISDLVEFGFSGKSETYFLGFIPGTVPDSYKALLIYHGTQALERFFLKAQGQKFLARFRKTIGFAEMIALPKGESDCSAAIPSLNQNEEDLVHLNDIISQKKVPDFRVGEFRGLPAIITGVPGRNVLEHNLFLISPLRPITEQSYALTRKFFLLAIFTLTFVIGIGWFFSRTLIAPIKDISVGVDNLMNLKLSEKTNVTTGDELEDIATGLNFVRAEMRELLRAQRVCDLLIPQEALVLEQIRMRICHFSEVQFPEEILDYYQLDDEKAAFVIIRVPGKNISTAFFLGMAKMAVRVLLETERNSPTEVFSALRANFLPQMEKLSNVSVFIGIVNLDKEEFNFSFAGNFFTALNQDTGFSPFMLHSRECLSSTGFSLMTAEERLPFPRGARLYVFSDPSLETTKSGSKRNLEKLHELLKSSCKIPFENVSSRLFDSQNRELQGKTPVFHPVLVIEK